MRIALDTNVLAYAEGVGDEVRCRMAREIVTNLQTRDVLIPIQVLGELHRVLTGKTGRKASEAKDVVMSWSDAFAVGDSTWSAMESAFDLVADHGLQIWDALIFAVAAEHKCRLLLSEDLQNGFTWGGVTVANPFAESRHPLIEAALGPA
jgi:predicted nucleic acid-binding protein